MDTPEVTYKDEEVVKATYQVDEKPSGKKFQGSWLVFEDGKKWVCSYRPIPEYQHLRGKKVIATGCQYHYAPYIQHIGGQHFKLTKMEEDSSALPCEKQ